MNGQNFSHTWLRTIGEILVTGTKTAPRGKVTFDTPHRTVIVDMLDPVLRVPARKLSYQFMTAEAHWILSGDDTTAGIVPWNKHIAQFSDDGERFFGAYGPKIRGQLDYVIGKLAADPDTRQACLTIWRENPPATKDYPCTIAMVFRQRTGKDGERYLDNHTFMRSSDAWLGLPYDVFNFSMVAHLICAHLNSRPIEVEKVGDKVFLDREPDPLLIPGSLYLTMASSHLYQSNEAEARECIGQTMCFTPKPVPKEFYTEEPRILIDALRLLRDSKPGHPLRWWEGN